MACFSGKSAVSGGSAACGWREFLRLRQALAFPGSAAGCQYRLPIRRSLNLFISESPNLPFTMIPLTWNPIDPVTGLPLTWDNPNLRWGSPSVLLEPGDPGYLPPAYYSPGKTKPKHTMKHQRYYPTRTGAQLAWLENFRNKIRLHAATLSLDDAIALAVIADCRWLHYVLGTWLPATRAWAEACTAATRQAATGTGGVLALPIFTPPPLPPAEPGAPGGALPAVVPMAEGALTRIFDYIAELKEVNGCTDAMCQDLGIIGAEDGAPDLATLRPDISATLSGSQVQIAWGWGGYGKWLDLCELQVDRGTGWQPLAFDTTPGCTDSAPQPATPAVWKYRAIYHANDARVGLWSNEVAVAVGG